jgi:hypothetical protein
VIKRSRERIEVEGIETTATSRAIYQGKHVIPTIELTFTTEDNELVVINLPAAEASKLADAMISSLKAALPKIPSRRSPRYE